MDTRNGSLSRVSPFLCPRGSSSSFHHLAWKAGSTDLARTSSVKVYIIEKGRLQGLAAAPSVARALSLVCASRVCSFSFRPGPAVTNLPPFKTVPSPEQKTNKEKVITHEQRRNKNINFTCIWTLVKYVGLCRLKCLSSADLNWI
jgi:hypothetical protein